MRTYGHRDRREAKRLIRAEMINNLPIVCVWNERLTAEILADIAAIEADMALQGTDGMGFDQNGRWSERRYADDLAGELLDYESDYDWMARESAMDMQFDEFDFDDRYYDP